MTHSTTRVYFAFSYNFFFLRNKRSARAWVMIR